MYKTLFADTENAFGINSPAKNMKPIGTNIILGVDEGMEDAFDTFTDTIKDFYDNYVKTWFVMILHLHRNQVNRLTLKMKVF